MSKGTVSKKNKRKQTNVEFQLFSPAAQSVKLAGDFNQWNPEATPLQKEDAGKWKITLNLSPGRYEYRFWVDGTWQNDPEPVECVPNAFGTWNCVKKVE